MSALLIKGGWVMYPILLCSVTALAVVAERFIYYFWTKENYKVFLREIKKYLSAKDIKAAIRFSRARRTALSRIAMVYLRNINRKQQVLEDILHRTGSQQLKKMEERLPVLAVIAHLTPLMGLLGTVLGMITCFQKIQSIAGPADVNSLAGGIWTALLTTAFGLIVAIPVMAAYHFFENLVSNRADQMQYLISELNQIFNKPHETIHSS